MTGGRGSPKCKLMPMSPAWLDNVHKLKGIAREQIIRGFMIVFLTILAARKRVMVKGKNKRVWLRNTDDRWSILSCSSKFVLQIIHYSL